MGPVERLRSMADIFEQRNAVYGDSTAKTGALLQGIFPDGVDLRGPRDQQRYAILAIIASKVARYAQNFADGGHEDSLDDIAVYCAMLNCIDVEGTCFPDEDKLNKAMDELRENNQTSGY